MTATVLLLTFAALYWLLRRSPDTPPKTYERRSTVTTWRLYDQDAS